MRPELETIDVVRAERDSALAELETVRQRLRVTPDEWVRKRSVLMQMLAASAIASAHNARLTPSEARRLMAAFEDIDALAHRLVAERDAARAEVAALSDPLLKEVSITPGALEMTLEGATAVIKRLAIAMVTFLEGHGAKNYVEQKISLGTNGFVMLVQRQHGKTPHEFRAEADARAERLKKLIVRVQKYVREDRAVTPGATRLARVVDEIAAELRGTP